MASWDFTVDSDKQNELAKFLETESLNYEQQVNSMYLEINNMGEHWVGEDYEMFKEGTENYRGALTDLSSGIKMYAEHLRSISSGTDDLADELIDIVSNMTHKI